MNIPFIIHLLFSLILTLGSTALAYVLGGTVWSLSVLSAALGLWLLQHLAGFSRLLDSLRHPDRPLPASNGIWSFAFTQLAIQRQSQNKHRDLLRDSLRRFQAAAETLPVGIILLTRNGQAEWFNHRALDLLQLKPQQALDGSLKKHFDDPQWLEFFEQASGSEPLHGQFSLPQSNGLMRQLHLQRLVVARGAELLLVEDISRSQQLEATRTAFVANVSHELRTPLTVINGFLETLADYPELPEAQRLSFVALMQKESARMLTLINDLLTLSTLEDRHGSDKHFEPLDLSALVEQTVQAGQTLSGGRHTFIRHITPAVKINGNSRDLYQALSNLVFNAVHYTPPEGTITVSLTLSEHPNPYKPPLARFAVADNGPGIAAEHLPHLTDRFYRVDKGRSRDSGGTGLGLAIAKHALAHHDSLLEIRSTLGQGSEFAASLQTLPEASDGGQPLQAA